MAARRISASSLDWAEFASKVPQAPKAAFAALKNRTDSYVRAISALPESSPKIDWANYKAKVAVSGMVQDFQSKYEALKVPYPKDTLSGSIDQQAQQQKANYEKFVADSKTRIQGIKEEQAKWEAMMPVEEMCKEDMMDYVPHLLKPTPEKPALWPFEETKEEW